MPNRLCAPPPPHTHTHIPTSPTVPPPHPSTRCARRMLSSSCPMGCHTAPQRLPRSRRDSARPLPSTEPIDTAKTVIQADVTGATYRGMLQALPELYRTNGMARLYSGGLARTIRTCGAFFIVNQSLVQIAPTYAS
jgi:hypothetical protein